VTAKRGASLSTKQIEQASLRGRLVGFKFFSTQPAHEVWGYIVGMDDYHWMVASRSIDAPTPSTEQPKPVTLILLHKSKIDAVVLQTEVTLESEPVDIREAVSAVGNPYWDQLRSHHQEERKISA